MMNLTGTILNYSWIETKSKFFLNTYFLFGYAILLNFFDVLVCSINFGMHFSYRLSLVSKSSLVIAPLKAMRALLRLFFVWYNCLGPGVAIKTTLWAFQTLYDFLSLSYRESRLLHFRYFLAMPIVPYTFWENLSNVWSGFEFLSSLGCRDSHSWSDHCIMRLRSYILDTNTLSFLKLDTDVLTKIGPTKQFFKSKFCLPQRSNFSYYSFFTYLVLRLLPYKTTSVLAVKGSLAPNEWRSQVETDAFHRPKSLLRVINVLCQEFFILYNTY